MVFAKYLALAKEELCVQTHLVHSGATSVAMAYAKQNNMVESPGRQSFSPDGGQEAKTKKKTHFQGHSTDLLFYSDLISQ